MLKFIFEYLGGKVHIFHKSKKKFNFYNKILITIILTLHMERENSTFYPKIISDSITFDDVLLIPSYSEVLPREVDISTQLTKGLRLNVPIVSAAMDTVTERDLAIAIARQGGIGFIHKNMTIEAQAEQVRGVKRSESGMIIDPVTLTGDANVGQALQLMKQYSIGILTNRDLRFEKDNTKLVKQVMTTKDLVTAPVGTTFANARDILQEHKIEKLPVIDNNGKLIGLITYKDLMKIKSNPNACKDQHGRLVVGAAVGVTKDIMDRVSALVGVGVDEASKKRE